MLDHSPLPPGQRVMSKFPRFGVVAFARRAIKSTEIKLEISGTALERSILVTSVDLASLPRVNLIADFHCAAGWTYRGAEWSGFRFKDIFDTFIAPNARTDGTSPLVVLRGQDGYRNALPLTDLLTLDVLIADRLDDAPLTIGHGAPLRLVAPAHYGYKSVKHLDRIELRVDARGYRPLLPRVMDHPRARVAFEERGRFVPSVLLRYFFRPFIRPIIRQLESIGTLTDSAPKS
jgi:DMSO/TMAO reductase YedYZ molybdopterin-dependent catalytic subunit